MDRLEDIAEEIIDDYFFAVMEGLDPWGSVHFSYATIEACEVYGIQGRNNLKRLERLVNKFLRKYNRDWMFRIKVTGETNNILKVTIVWTVSVGLMSFFQGCLYFSDSLRVGITH